MSSKSSSGSVRLGLPGHGPHRSSGHRERIRRPAPRRGRGRHWLRARAPSTFVAMVPGSRSSASRPPASLPRKLFREVPTTTGRPIATISSRRLRSSRLCSSVLAEADAGVEPDALLRHALGHREREPLLQEGASPRRPRRRSSGPAASSAGSPRMCTRQQPAPASATSPASSGSERKADTSFTIVAPAASAASATRDLGGVDRHALAGRRQPLDDRAARGAAPPRPRPARRPDAMTRRPRRAGRPLAREPHPVLDSGIAVDEAAAVAERVGGRVDDAHDERGLHGSQYRGLCGSSRLGRLRTDAVDPYSRGVLVKACLNGARSPGGASGAAGHAGGSRGRGERRRGGGGGRPARAPARRRRRRDAGRRARWRLRSPRSARPARAYP